MAKKQFKAESKRLLDMMIHSIYTHREIFLRELISNASDAVDKMCYRALTEPDIGMSRSDFFIEIRPDREKRTLIISDNGIGMTKEELESNLGTIARSGSLSFKNEMRESGQEQPEDIDIIGQFGVGFYSAFMVSDDVTVISRAWGSDEAWKWQSNGSDGYTITACEKENPGTDIIMVIKEDTDDEKYGEFLEEYRLSSLVKKYSDYIRYPIRMDRERSRPKEGGEEHEMETYIETETLNSMVPVWQKNKNEVTEEEYREFYKEKFHDFEEPLATIHVDAEGIVSYRALLFIPAKASWDYYTKEYKRGLQLYSSGVMIMDRCEDLLPEHFRFVRGVVDSPDLSLNISREMLQHDRQLKVIATNLEKKIKNELLKLLSNDRDKYETFFGQFGAQLKYGVLADFGAHKELLQDLLIFKSSDSDKLCSLVEYVARMKPEQKDIFYATGESAVRISALPQAERVKQKGFEILYFTEEVDEFVAQTLRDYQEKPFKSVNSDDLDLDSEEDKKKLEEQQEQYKDLLAFVKDSLDGKISEVKLSRKLVSQPVCLSAGGGLSFEMEKYLNAVQPNSGAKADRVLELNPSHQLFETLKDLYDADKDMAKRYTQIIYNQALILAGLPIEDPAAYSEMVFELMK